MKRKISGKRIVVMVALLFILCWLVLYLAKDLLLDYAVIKTKHRLKDQYKLELTIKHYKLNGWSEVVMNSMNCADASKDTLISFSHLNINIKLWPLLTGKIRLEKMNAVGGSLDIGKLKELQHKKKREEEPEDSSKLAKAKKYLNYIRDIADLIPDNFVAKNIGIKYHDSTSDLSAYIDSISYLNSSVSTKSIFTIKNQRQTWLAIGTFNKNTLETHLNVASDVTGFYELAFVKSLAKAKVGFRSFKLDITSIDDNTDDIYVKGNISATKVLIYNPRLSTDTISVNSGGVDFSMTLTGEQVMLDSTSRVHLNELSAMISSDYKYKAPETIHARLELSPVPAQDIIKAMPDGAFETAKSITLGGNMGYHLDFYLNIDTKDSIKIDARVINDGIRIISTGQADLRKLNGTFTYYPYNSRRPIIVGIENPDYTPLSGINQKLIDAVVSSEDPNFFNHHGIETDAIESSFLRNLQNGSFRQGGSTITMQLVKNVFLTHKKTIDRKLEEFFLVWLIENMHITTKSRMLEVYLNIIEWGPDIYGIGEASKFYFNKTPADLTLNESIFLAKIIPQPLGFMNRFDANGNLKENFQKKVLGTVNRLSRRGKIGEDEQGSYWPEVQITGPAKNFIKIVPQLDSLRVRDSINRLNDW